MSHTISIEDSPAQLELFQDKAMNKVKNGLDQRVRPSLLNSTIMPWNLREFGKSLLKGLGSILPVIYHHYPTPQHRELGFYFNRTGEYIERATKNYYDSLEPEFKKRVDSALEKSL